MAVFVKRLIFLFISLILVNTVNAGSFKVFPLKLELNQKSRTTLFKITNTGDEEVTVQLETVKWSQDDKGEDKYESTTDIVYFPKIVKIAVGEQQIIRIGYRAGKAGALEKTYRIFAQELPNLRKQKQALKFSLRFSVPIFVYSFKSKPDAEISGSNVKNGQLNILVKNAGNKHFIVKSIFVTGLKDNGQQLFNAESGGWYVLPGSEKPFSVLLPENECNRSDKISFQVTTSAGDFEEILPVFADDCVKSSASSNSTNAFQ